jgi:hypothetical protein
MLPASSFSSWSTTIEKEEQVEERNEGEKKAAGLNY